MKKFISIIFLIPLGFIAPDAKALPIPAKQDTTIKIGLLIRDNNSLAAKHGAELAILKANETGRGKTIKFQLVVRSMEGPWGTGSKQAVDLIFEEKVAAILGSHDGRNAHLVEQVSAKERIIFVSAWAGDPTLSQAFVPWFFSCVPNDNQLADALIKEIYSKRNLSEIAVFSDNGYDSKLATECFLKKSRLAGKKDPVILFYDNSTLDFNSLIDQINQADIRGIILFGEPEGSLNLIKQLQLRKINQPIFGSFALLNEDIISDQDLKYYENVTLICSLNKAGSKFMAFSQNFKHAFGLIPGPVASYSFDGMNLIIEAIKNVGTDREKIQNYLSGIHYEGVTGLIQYDERGNRVGAPLPMKIKNGVPVLPDK